MASCMPSLALLLRAWGWKNMKREITATLDVDMVKLQLFGVFDNIWRQAKVLDWILNHEYNSCSYSNIQTWYNTQWPSSLQHVLLKSGLGWVHQPTNLPFSGFSMLCRSLLSSCNDTVTPSCKHESSHMENQVTKKMINGHLDVVTYFDMVKKIQPSM